LKVNNNIKSLFPLFIFWLGIGLISAQQKNTFLYLEAINSKGVIKEIYAPAINAGFPKLANSYSLIVMPVEVVADAVQIKVYLNQEAKKEPYIVVLDTNKIDLVKTKKLAGFPFFYVRNKVQEIPGLIYPVLVLQEDMENYYAEFMKKYSQSDVEELKKELEKQFTQ
jgi:hypothetical protein